MLDNAGYKKLIVWQKSDQLVLDVYKVTQLFPKSELFCLTSQIRRSALSVPTNIVEGYSRNGKNEFKRFVIIALGSLGELRYLLTVAQRLKYISESDLINIDILVSETGKMLWKFYKSL